MTSGGAGGHSAVDGFVTIWTAQRPVLTVLLGLPGMVLSSAFSVFLVFTIFDSWPAGVVVLVIAAVMVAARVILWSVFVATRSVAVSDTHLAVRRGPKMLTQMSWADMSSVELMRGDTLVRMTVDVTSGDASFPYIVARPKDVWSVEGSFDSLLAVLPADRRRLVEALRGACASRSMVFRVEGET